jgi:carbonic anhydrase/acetyltransferase-like protein (isoleucine patch superfamily)
MIMVYGLMCATVREHMKSSQQFNSKGLQSKFGIRDENNRSTDGSKLYCVYALRDFGSIKAGDVGGLVSGEHNLSHYGSAWIGRNAKALDNALVTDHALITGCATIFDNAKLCDHATVADHAEIGQYATVSGRSVVSGRSKIIGASVITGDAKITDEALVTDKAFVAGRSILGGHDVVRGDVEFRHEALPTPHVVGP